MTATDREIEEMVARCVSSMVYYRNSEKTRQIEAEMIADVRAVAAWADRAGLRGHDATKRLLLPLQAELLARFGSEGGGLLYGVFARHFKGMARPAPAALPISLISVRI